MTDLARFRYRHLNSMRRFKSICALSVIAISSLLAVTGCQHRMPVATGEWRTLLDASHTNGWKMVGPGVLKWEADELVTYGGMGLLYYEQERLGDCKIRVVFKLTGEHDNSGVFIRMPHLPQDPWDAVNHGYEVQIDNMGDDWHRMGCLYSFTKARNVVNAKVGEWTTLLITLKGNRTIVQVNGTLVTDYTEGQPVPERKLWYEAERGRRARSGYIGLQNHGGDAQVHFKEVSVAPLK